MTALKKLCGGIRPIACSSASWRQVTRAAAIPLGREIRESEIGQYQYATGATGPQMYHRITTTMERNPQKVIFSLDLKNAFNSIKTEMITEQIEKTAPKWSLPYANTCKTSGSTCGSMEKEKRNSYEPTTESTKETQSAH